jgi:3-isopropylmalate/(R)-2-methylmalate dehydratase small subunit
MQNGIVTVVLPTEEIDVIMTNALRVPGYKMTVNLENQILKDKLGFSSKFDFDPFRKDSILKGLDDIGITLQNEEDISIYESKK